jgi:type I restriction-modification system DNA methylase subunit/predicted type IV restriction endonuclease
MTVPAKVSELVERFDRNLNAYKQGRYNETQLRLEFINPLFEELGWDIINKQGYAEAYKEVVHEDAIKVGGATKAPDYSFRIGGTRKFFLEAKKPSVDIKQDIHPAYQLRRYAWSAKLPLSILTDFEEFAVYDCRVKPVKTDKASHSRILYITYTDYIKRWEEIASIFSREAILKGSFDKYVESKKTKRGTAEVDTAFLQEIERWRDLLARNIALRNPNLNHRELNFSVQRTIDRIIFLRICEDRGIEFYGKLMALQNGTRIYQRLFQLFRQADDRYNSGLFHFRPEKERPEDSLDRLTPDLNIDDRVLKEILKKLYYPDSPYEFSVLPADILGQVYEQFLGKVIRLTPAHHAVVEDKPEVRKAGGVYYTPTYIVDYIVKQTVGKLVKSKKPGPRGAVSKLKILDPACGSGSFLLGAYQYLLDWNRDEYIKDDPAKWATGRNPRLYQTDTGEWKLTTDERKRILLNNIYGVDIDPQAVEVTKLSLLLKVLEGEDEQTISQQFVLFHQRVLPDLANNIKCGNSLIGPDFYKGKQMTLLNEEEMYHMNVFDWEAEFPEIMKAGGFDAVIGNPPYGAEFTDLMSNYFKRKCNTFIWRGESYILFVERGLQLLKRGGLFGFIIPDTYLNLGFTELLRVYVLQNSKLREIVLLPSNVFEGATVDTTLLFTQKTDSTSEYHKTSVNVKLFNKKTNITVINQPYREFQTDTSFWYEQKAFNVQSDNYEDSVVNKIENEKVQLSDIADIFSGIKVYEVGKGSPAQTTKIRDTKPFTSKCQVNNDWLPFCDGKHIGRYQSFWDNDNWIYYGPWLAAPRNPKNFKAEKILIRKIVGHTLFATYISETSYCNTLLFVLKIHNTLYSYHYILGILNSILMGWYFRKKFQISPDDTFPQIMIRDIFQFPIPAPDKARYDRMVDLVEQMLELHKQLAEAKVPQAKTVLQRQIEATDRQIDQLVYELYGLTGEEIRIVEGSGE